MLLQAAAFGGVFTGFGIARDFETRLRAAAAARGAEPQRDRAGYALAALVRAAIVTIAVLTVVALLAGSG